MPKPPHIDDDTWRRMYAYGGDPYLPQQIKVDVLSEWSDETWSAEGFRDLIVGLIDKIPPEYRSSAKVEFHGGGYDESGRLEIYYCRPSTEDEINERVERFLAYARASQQDERNTYERLRQKFESQS